MFITRIDIKDLKKRPGLDLMERVESEGKLQLSWDADSYVNQIIIRSRVSSSRVQRIIFYE